MSRQCKSTLRRRNSVRFMVDLYRDALHECHRAASPPFGTTSTDRYRKAIDLLEEAMPLALRERSRLSGVKKTAMGNPAPFLRKLVTHYEIDEQLAAELLAVAVRLSCPHLNLPAALETHSDEYVGTPSQEVRALDFEHV